VTTLPGVGEAWIRGVLYYNGAELFSVDRQGL